MRKWWFLAAAISCEVTGSLALKGALEQSALYVLVVTGYVASFVLLAFVIREGMPLGVAYGIWGASGVALTASFAAIVYGEAFTALMILGLALVVAGVILVEVGSQHPSRSTT
jgi:small multidrug resistance pump